MQVFLLSMLCAASAGTGEKGLLGQPTTTTKSELKKRQTLRDRAAKTKKGPVLRKLKQGKRFRLRFPQYSLTGADERPTLQPRMPYSLFQSVPY